MKCGGSSGKREIISCSDEILERVNWWERGGGQTPMQTTFMLPLCVVSGQLLKTKRIHCIGDKPGGPVAPALFQTGGHDPSTFFTILF